MSLVDHASHFLEGGNWEMRDVIVSSGVFVAVGDLGVASSDDGVTWTAPVGPRDLFRVASTGSVLVAVGLNKHARSTDLTTWTEVAVGGIGDVVFADDRFLIVGEGFGLTSSDGLNFVEHAQPAISRVAVGVVGGTSLYVGFNYPDVRRTSRDGRTWSEPARDDKNAIDDVIFVR